MNEAPLPRRRVRIVIDHVERRLAVDLHLADGGLARDHHLARPVEVLLAETQPHAHHGALEPALRVVQPVDGRVLDDALLPHLAPSKLSLKQQQNSGAFPRGCLGDDGPGRAGPGMRFYWV